MIPLLSLALRFTLHVCGRDEYQAESERPSPANGRWNSFDRLNNSGSDFKHLLCWSIVHSAGKRRNNVKVIRDSEDAPNTDQGQ